MIADEAAAKAWLQESGFVDTDGLERLERLIELLTEENQRQNLVSASSLLSAWQRHICDSVQLLRYLPKEGVNSWLDLGSGAGFPGIVIAAVKPDLPVTLVESRTRRIEWLNRLGEELGLANVRVEGSRLELVEARSFDVISARAFAPLESLLKLAARFSTKSTLWLLPKGRSAAQELEELRGWDQSFHVERSLTDSQAGIVVGNLAGRKG